MTQPLRPLFLTRLPAGWAAANDNAPPPLPDSSFKSLCPLSKTVPANGTVRATPGGYAVNAGER